MWKKSEKKYNSVFDYMIGIYNGFTFNDIVRIKEPCHEKTYFCICENKDADQLRGNRKADQRLCFHYIDSTIPLLSKSEISSL